MENLYQHFLADEKQKLKIFSTWIDQVGNNYSPYLTYFLDPREQEILTILVNGTDLQVQFEGGIAEAERKRALIYPDYFVPELSDFELSFLEIKYAEKFNHLEHRQILGTLMSQGIKREQIGDILFEHPKWQLICAKHLQEYLQINLKKISKVPVRLEEISKEHLLSIKTMNVTKRLTITSLRLDNIIASVYNISRQTTKQLILNEKCKVNFAHVQKADMTINEKDTISVRGYGRFKIDKLLGKTKKGRYIIQITKFK